MFLINFTFRKVKHTVYASKKLANEEHIIIKFGPSGL